MSTIIRETFEKNEGIFRLIPSFVPRALSTPGGRLRLHPDDLYAFGMERGAIKVRYFSSVIHSFGGPDAAPDEGMSYVSYSNDPKDRFLLKDAIDELGAQIIGKELWDKYGTWPMHSKFFDFGGPMFHHLHLDFAAAARVGQLGKPEGYYFPIQYNSHPGEFPHTFFGFAPDVTREQVRQRVEMFLKGDNRLTELSRAFRLQLGTGWYTPPGVLHAPGSYLTYEPQWNSAVSSVFENVTNGAINSYATLVSDCPEDKKYDVDYIMSLLDWEKNVDPDYRKHYFRPPVPARQEDTFDEKWIMYGNGYIAAKELTVYPGQTAVVKDGAAYGCIFIQGHGKFGGYDAETAGLLRFGGLSADEYFVSQQAAQKGVVIQNQSAFEPIVMLKHFGPNHPDEPKMSE